MQILQGHRHGNQMAEVLSTPEYFKIFIFKQCLLLHLCGVFKVHMGIGMVGRNGGRPTIKCKIYE